MKEDCLFCRIISGQMSVPFLYESEDIVAFRDIHPQAPVHILVMPKKHIPKISSVQKKEGLLIGRIINVANSLAAEENIADSGYRLIINCGEDAGQEIFHIHLHLLGGRKMSWPPG